MDYHNYGKKSLGYSDIAELVLVGYMADRGASAKLLHYGSDGCYSAYLVDGNADIGSAYKLVASYESWLKVYDDDGLTATFKADEIKVYRCGMFGTIIQLIKN